MERSPLYLVLDTNVFLGSTNHYHDSQTRDSRPAIRMLRDFRAGNFGTLPPAVVWIPWIVRSELVGISSRDLSKCFQPNLTTAGQAGAALDYLDAVTLEEGTCVIYQNQMEFAEANQLRTFEDDKDELVLLSCFQVKAFYSHNVWLITNDVRLQARAMRSGIGSLSFSALKHAMTLKNGPESRSGCSFVDSMPEPWRHLVSPKRSATLFRHHSETLEDPTLSSHQKAENSTSNYAERRTGAIFFDFARNRDFFVWVLNAACSFCRDFFNVRELCRRLF